MRTSWLGYAAAIFFSAGGSAVAQDVMAEVYHLGELEVRVLLHPFLTDEEISTLRLVGQSQEALGLFVSEGPGYAALSVAPEEGFVRNGLPVDSAIALSGLDTLSEARAAANAACNSARTSSAACVTVLAISPR
ncbi:MAG: hypothetical protein ACXIUW_11235 [Roseinatronobacter sp.]